MDCAVFPKTALVILGIMFLFASFISYIALKEYYGQWKMERDSTWVMIGYLIHAGTINQSFTYSEQLYFSSRLENHQCALVCLTSQQAQRW